MLLIRNATIRDLDVITAVEAACFSPAEAATRDTLADRLHRYPDHFWLLFEDETLVSFLDGFVTDLPDGSLEAHLFQQTQARARLDLDTLRDLRATLADADSLVCDLICQAEEGR